MKLLLIGCMTFFLQIGLAAVHPINDVSITTHSQIPYLNAKVFLEDSCMKLDGNTLLFDSRKKVITLMQQVKETPQPACTQMINPNVSEFALHDLPKGVFKLVDGYDNNPLGVLRVNPDGEIELLEE